jgi:hypothetical protein
MTTPDSFEIQIKDGVYGWWMSGDSNVLRVHLTLERFKELREIVRSYVISEGDSAFFSSGTMQVRAQHAIQQAGISAPEARALLHSVEQSSTGLQNSALFGHAMFSTVRVLLSRPPDTIEAAMAGEKTRWGRPMIGVATELDMGSYPAHKDTP